MTTRIWATHEVAAETGASYRQLDYWTRTARVYALSREQDGSGFPRLWAEEEVEVIRDIVTLIDAGFTLDGAVIGARKLAAGEGPVQLGPLVTLARP